MKDCEQTKKEFEMTLFQSIFIRGEDGTPDRTREGELYVDKSDIWDFFIKMVTEQEKFLLNAFKESVESNVTYELLKNNIMFSLADKIKDNLYE